MKFWLFQEQLLIVENGCCRPHLVGISCETITNKYTLQLKSSTNSNTCENHAALDILDRGITPFDAMCRCI